jgi:hypothetical protein
MAWREGTHASPPPQAPPFTPLRPQGRALAHGSGAQRSLGCAPLALTLPKTVEFLLLLWDEMDDWLGVCRHLLRRQLS